MITRKMLDTYASGRKKFFRCLQNPPASTTNQTLPAKNTYPAIAIVLGLTLHPVNAQEKLIIENISQRNTTVSGDFNGDGIDDIAIGIPHESIGSIEGAGAVNVIYGTTHGLQAHDNQLWHQNSGTVAGLAEKNDNFGSSLASGDFNNDGYTDLAIAVVNEDIGSLSNSGAVNILYGSQIGLTEANNRVLYQGTFGIQGTPEINDHYGSAVTVGYFNDDEFADLAVGISHESIGTIPFAGAVNVIFGSNNGLTGEGNQIWHQNSFGVKDEVEPLDLFGSSLAAADFNDDGIDDLAIGVPNESVGIKQSAGSVSVIFGTQSGLTYVGNQLWHQNVTGIAGEAETNDAFGSSLTTANFDNDRFPDLAIGVPNESIGPISRAGAVNVVYGSPTGLQSLGNQLWHQDSVGIGGGAEINDQFGATLITGDFDNDTFIDLAIGVPGESIGSKLRAGMVNVIYGSSVGLTAAYDQIWHQDSNRIGGVSEPYDQFGCSLASGDFNNDGNSDLIVGVGGEDIGSISNAGVINVLYGSPDRLNFNGNQIWYQDSDQIAGISETNDGFGCL